MDYNFDEIIPREGTDSVKWDMVPTNNLLAMWVADMDFKTAPAILEALNKRVDHGILGYTLTSASFFDAIVSWWKKKHNYKISNEWIIPVPGILPAISAIIRSTTIKGDNILLLTPIYDHFFSSINNCDRNALESELIYRDGNYSIDFEDFEEKAADPKTKLMLLCNPHNPTGRVWTKDELIQIGDICAKHDVLVVSDEIHADLVYDGFQHTPFASLGTDYSLNCFTCCSPSKPFNLAGVQVAYVFTENEKLLKGVQDILELQETAFLNGFAGSALVAAYTEGEDWLENLKIYVYENYIYLNEFLSKNLPSLKVTPLEATYLVWIDIKELKISSQTFSENLKDAQGLWLNAGTMYGKAGEGFLRMNIGCPRALLKEGLERLKQYIENQAADLNQ